MADDKKLTLVDAMIDAGLPVALDGNGDLMPEETQHMLDTVGMVPEAARGSWYVQKLRGRCFAFEGSGCPSGATCVYGPARRADCENYIRNNCSGGKC